MTKNSYALEAANWWASIIKNSTHEFIDDELKKFCSLLSSEIARRVNLNGVLTISTCNRRNLLLDTIAKDSLLSVDIPSGYEMKILINDVAIYNNDGCLIRYF